MFSKRIAVLGVAAILALSALAPTVSASPRSGELHVTKDCTDYHFAAGESCTIIVSNIKAIPAGSRVVYADAAGATLDTDVSLVAGPGNVGHGHCTLDPQALPGLCTFSGGTGQFTHFHASVAVSPGAPNIWYWDGEYSFHPPN